VLVPGDQVQDADDHQLGGTDGERSERQRAQRLPAPPACGAGLACMIAPVRIAVYVTSNAEPYKEWMAHATRPELGSPRDRILALFDALAEQVQPGQCRGCPFLMTLAEYPDPDHPAHKEAVAVKAWARERLRRVTRELAIDTPVSDALAEQLVIAMEGVYATVQALGNDGPARQARALAVTLLDTATGPAPADQV
jgi:hypothetical protein